MCVCSGVLGRCVYTAYKARRAVLQDSASSHHHSTALLDQRAGCHGNRSSSSSCVLSVCERASRLLAQSISQHDLTAPHCHTTKVCLSVCLSTPPLLPCDAMHPPY